MADPSAGHKVTGCKPATVLLIFGGGVFWGFLLWLGIAFVVVRTTRYVRRHRPPPIRIPFPGEVTPHTMPRSTMVPNTTFNISVDRPIARVAANSLDNDEPGSPKARRWRSQTDKHVETRKKAGAAEEDRRIADAADSLDEDQARRWRSRADEPVERRKEGKAAEEIKCRWPGHKEGKKRPLRYIVREAASEDDAYNAWDETSE